MSGTFVLTGMLAVATAVFVLVLRAHRAADRDFKEAMADMQAANAELEALCKVLEAGKARNLGMLEIRSGKPPASPDEPATGKLLTAMPIIEVPFNRITVVLKDEEVTVKYWDGGKLLYTERPLVMKNGDTLSLSGFDGKLKGEMW